MNNGRNGNARAVRRDSFLAGLLREYYRTFLDASIEPRLKTDTLILPLDVSDNENVTEVLRLRVRHFRNQPSLLVTTS